MKRETTLAKIMELCSSTVPGAAPVYIPVKAAGRGLLNECFPKRPADGPGAWRAAGQRLGCLALGEYLGNAGGSCHMGKPGGLGDI